MSNHTLSHATREALDNISTYLSGQNEAVQYAFSFLADMVTQNPSVMLGGIPAGSLPANSVVTDPNGKVFAIDPAITGTFAGSISLNLKTGEFQASWTIQQTTSTITGYLQIRRKTQGTAQRPVHVRDPAKQRGLLRADYY